MNRLVLLIWALAVVLMAAGCSEGTPGGEDVPQLDDGADADAGADAGDDGQEADVEPDAGDDGGDDGGADAGADKDPRCGVYQIDPVVPPGGPVDCAPIDTDPDFTVCRGQVDHCEAAAANSRGCQALCESAGLECLVAYDADSQDSCQVVRMKPCDEIGALDYCWCAPVEDPPFEMDPEYCDSGRVVVFDPYGIDFIAPWPSNIYTRTDLASSTCIYLDFGPDRVREDETDFIGYPALKDQLGRLDGFGTSAKVAFVTNCEMENSIFDPDAISKITPADTVKPDAPVILINIDESSYYYGQPQPVLVTYEEDTTSEGGLILLHPTRPLRSGTKYAAILTGRLHTESGDCLGPAPMTARLLMGKARGPGLERIQGDVDHVFDVLAQNNIQIEKKDVAALTIFTTMDVRREMLHMAQAVLEATEQNPPTIIPGSLVWEQKGSSELAWNVTGEFESITYRDPATGLFEYDQDGLPIPLGTHRIKFKLRLPMTPGPDQGGPPYQVFVYHHGLGGDRNEGGGVSERLAGAHGGTPRGWATASIDTIHHGERCTKEPVCIPAECEPCAGGTTGDLTAIFHFFSIELDSKGFDMEKARDNFRQDYVDWLVFIRLMTNPDGLDVLPANAPDGIPDIQDDKVGFTGLSLGGVTGGGIVPLSPDIEVAFINVGGGGLTNILLESTIFGTFINLLKPPEAKDYDVKRFFPIIQTIFDPGDPVNFATGMLWEPFTELGCQPRPLLFQMVERDLYVPNLTNESLGRAAGTLQVGEPYHEVLDLPYGGALPISANLPGGLTTGYFQFSDNCTADGAWHLPFNHGDMICSEVGTRQWRHFIETFYETGTAEIIDPYLPPLDCR